jgi:hypothetical protein
VTRYGDVMTSTGGYATPRREKAGDDASWAAVNLTRPKNEENPRGGFS